MLDQTSGPSDEPSSCLQVETEQASSSKDAASGKDMHPWRTGCVFVCLMVAFCSCILGSAWAVLLPAQKHAHSSSRSTKTAHHVHSIAFNPALPIGRTLPFWKHSHSPAHPAVRSSLKTARSCGVIMKAGREDALPCNANAGAWSPIAIPGAKRESRPRGSRLIMQASAEKTLPDISEGFLAVPDVPEAKAAGADYYAASSHKCERRKTRTVMIGNVPTGSDHPVRTQTMTTTVTWNVEDTVAQIKRVADAGIDIVRVTVQNMKEAKACEHIKSKLLEDGYTIPIVADIHFTPNVALVAAQFCDKIRVNPGNFVDGKKTFDTITEGGDQDAIVKKVQEQIEEEFSPLVLKLKEQGKALRIGVNHGSLSERILFQYGDSPEGMVASAVEFGEICRKLDYHNFVFSMKSSNPKVMVQAYRALAAEMKRLGWDYPLHLGVTEAGGGADGRIKSATGIGALLLDGLGDTVRVSLTEDPEFEAKPCISLARIAVDAAGKGLPEDFEEPSGRREEADGAMGPVGRRVRKPNWPSDVPLNQDGSVLSLTTVDEMRSLDTKSLADRLGLLLRKDGQLQKDITSVDALVFDGPLPEDIESDIFFVARIRNLLDSVNVGVICRPGAHDMKGSTLMIDASSVKEPLPDRLGGYALVVDGEESVEELKAALEKTSPRMILFKPRSQEGVTFLGRRFFARLNSLEAGMHVPIMLWFRYPKSNTKQSGDEDDLVVTASADFGSLFVDSIGEGILWDAEAMSPNLLRESAFNLLQASRMRISKTEFISCPSCGRTLFDLQEVTAKIKERTGHLPGVRIAVMGCIVNGPGEMADADFGYVGSLPGKIDLYVNYDVVRKGIKSEDSVEALVDLIKENGRWKDPPSPEDEEEEQLATIPEKVMV